MRSGPALPPAQTTNTSSLRRRMAAFTYEGVLLFGVLMVAGYLYASLTQQRHALLGQWGLRGFLFIVLGIYFVWFWTHGGQTVAMKTWYIRLVTADGCPVGQGRAIARYLLSWIWFLPALASIGLSGLQGGGPLSAALLAGVAGYAALALLNPQRQYWHDVVCGTRLIDTRPARS